MKRLIMQNGVEIDSSKECKIFDCKNCGCKFESNEYEIDKHFEKTILSIIEITQFIDACFTCKEICIITESNVDS